MKNLKLILCSLCLLAMSAPALAQQALDARSMGMGGTGVASSKYRTAAFHNPALAARYDETDDVSLVLPSVSAVLYDHDELIDNVDDLKDAIDLDATSTPEEIAKATKLLNDVKSATMDLQASAGTSFVLPNETVTVGLFVMSHIDSFGFGDIGDIPTDIANAIAGNPLQSQAGALLVNITEYGLTLAKDFETPYGKLYLGATPKLLQVRSMQYVRKVNEFENSDIKWSDFDNAEVTGNLDLGVAFETNYDITLGVTAQNIIPQTLEVKRHSDSLRTVDADYKLNPVVTAGLAYNPVDWFTFTTEIEAMKRERFDNIEGTINGISGSDDDAQFFSTGVEFDLYKWFQLRAGYRKDILGNIPNIVTAGLGISPFDTLHIDLAGSVGESGVYGGSVEIAFTF